MYKKVLFLMSIVFVLSIVATSAADFIGGLRNVKGTGLVIRDQEEIAAKDGLRIHKGDRLKTGKDGAMGVIFSDNTRVSIGPDSEISIDDYVFYPDKGGPFFHDQNGQRNRFLFFRIHCQTGTSIREI